MTSLTYNPGVFKVPNADAAKRIILTPQAGQDTEERWVRETPYLRDLIVREVPLSADRLVVDFGCGIGRMSKALIEAAGCHVLGVDISQEMRALAPGYVQSERFSVVSPDVFRRMVTGGLRVDAAISIWVLQHCLKPADDVRTLNAGLKDGGSLFVVNNTLRAVPTREAGWVNDGNDVRALVRAELETLFEGALDVAIVGQMVSDMTFWGHYRQSSSISHA